ncbi:Membrane bound O-acyl transferase, MBOAT [Cordyceps fumosorosea ARSEF 2679]|uniref:O-acyltransferase n=1 Tax=Cordyceps fumosorosea (strain ARSEF 2679) TaxID=1081104 RepID=A0A162JQS4_CORFA|nr:Membrane bound O-acyl transferase, MBOAT [Cordyceps fumosorosea ARSEF 2679]OAA72412.1 Membrane bound O-acyl transferase, MBOAT [Cordyceps fumosorosea ARSEF 2679]
MATTATDVVSNGDAGVVRPRKATSATVHEYLKRETSIDGSLSIPESTASAATSGRSTPVAENAPPSNKAISSARKTLRAEQRQQEQQQQRRRRIFPTTDFASRLSHFDPDSDYRDFHGFFNLFWIGLAIMGLTTMLRHMKDSGRPFTFQIWSLFAVKLGHLAVADALMVATTAVALPLHRLARAAPRDSVWTWRRGGMALQAIYQVAWLAVWVAVPFWLEWTWTAQVFLLLHTMVLLMKMHSYAFYNGHLSETEKRLRRLDGPTRRGTSERSPPYIYPVAAAERRSSKAGLAVDLSGGRDDVHQHHEHTDGQSPLSKPEPNGKTTTTTTHECDSDDEVELLREALARELTSPMGHVTYPHNLTWANYVDYLLCPTLCYEIEYPRVPTINWTSLISKIVAVFGCIFLLTITSEDFILPVLADAEVRLAAISSAAATSSPQSWSPAAETLLVLAETISWLLFPFMLTLLLVFLVIFEYVLGAMAEITRFADRRFYADWWNSTDWMEFSRNWNVPVHAFLRRHVYSASRPFTGRAGATALTFLVSAVGHEIVMACITKKLRGYGFVCQMLQLPIVVLQRTRWVRGKRTLNNVCFWSSMIMGLSLICALYVLL